MRSALSIVLGALLMFVAAGCDDDPEEAVPAETSASTATQASPSVAPFASESSSATAAASPGTGETLWRWGNVTIVIPNDSGIIVNPGGDALAGLRAPLALSKLSSDDSFNSSLVWIDPDDGRVIEEDVLTQDRAAFDSVLATITVSPLDVKTAGWPYKEQPTTDLTRRSEGALSYISPSPDSGLYVAMGVSDPGGPFIKIFNQQSAAFALLQDDSLVFDTSLVVEADMPVFKLWLAEVKPCDAEIEC